MKNQLNLQQISNPKNKNNSPKSGEREPTPDHNASQRPCHLFSTLPPRTRRNKARVPVSYIVRENDDVLHNSRRPGRKLRTTSEVGLPPLLLLLLLATRLFIKTRRGGKKKNIRRRVSRAIVTRNRTLHGRPNAGRISRR